MDMFTLHEFIYDYCDNEVTKIQTNSAILIQALEQDLLISRYSTLLKSNINAIQTYLQDFNTIPGIKGYDDKTLDGAETILHILVSFLAGYNKDSQVEKLPIYTETNITYVRDEFQINVEDVPAASVYYYSNLYHLILNWFFHRYSTPPEKRTIATYYYDYFIREQSLVYQLYDSSDLIMWVNYLAEHPIRIDLSQQRSINYDFIKNLLQSYNIRRDILLLRKFYNFHSYFAYVVKIYNIRIMFGRWVNLDYARYNYLSKIKFLQRRAGIPRDYQIIPTREILQQRSNNNISTSVEEVNLDRLREKSINFASPAHQATALVNNILLANDGGLMVEGPVLELLHVAQYGLTMKKNMVDLLIRTHTMLSKGAKRTLRSFYIVLLLKMGFPLTIITSLELQQMRATLLTGVKPSWPELNSAYHPAFNWGAFFSGWRFSQLPVWHNRIQQYYTHAIYSEQQDERSIINRFNIPPYNDVYYYPEIYNVYSYPTVNDMIPTELFKLYPPLQDKRIMQNWLLDNYSQFKTNDIPILYYIDYTISTAELAAKYGVANIYSRMLLLMIIDAQQVHQSDIYYRKPQYQVGDGKVVSTEDMQEKIINQATDIMKKFHNDDQNINFITFIHALDMLDYRGDINIGYNTYNIGNDFD